MKLIPGGSFVLAFLAFLMVCGVLRAEPSEGTPGRKLPFRGKIQAIDTAGQTITLTGKSARVFHLTPTTKITDGSGATSSLAAATVGEEVGGSYVKGADMLTLYSLRIGAKTGSKASSASAGSAPTSEAAASSPAATMPAPAARESEAAPAPAIASAPAAESPAAKVGKKQRFSGKVVSVDAAGQTLVVHGKADQTFTVTPDTKMTGAASLAELTPGEKVSGSYLKSPDGAKLTIASLKISK